MDEVRKHNLLYPLLYFLLFRLNKVKLVFFLSVFWIIHAIKNTSKIKVLQMPWNLNMFFLEYLRIFGTENTTGGHPPSHEGGGRAPCLVGPWWPSSTYSCTHTLHLPPKKSPSSSSTSSSSFCCHFRSPSSKLHSQNCFGGLFFGMWLLQWSN